MSSIQNKKESIAKNRDYENNNNQIKRKADNSGNNENKDNIVKKIKNNDGKLIIVRRNKQEDNENKFDIKVSSSGKSKNEHFLFFSYENNYKMKAFLLNFTFKNIFLAIFPVFF